MRIHTKNIRNKVIKEGTPYYLFKLDGRITRMGANAYDKRPNLS